MFFCFTSTTVVVSVYNYFSCFSGMPNRMQTDLNDEDYTSPTSSNSNSESGNNNNNASNSNENDVRLGTRMVSIYAPYWVINKTDLKVSISFKFISVFQFLSLIGCFRFSLFFYIQLGYRQTVAIGTGNDEPVFTTETTKNSNNNNNKKDDDITQDVSSSSSSRPMMFSFSSKLEITNSRKLVVRVDESKWCKVNPITIVVGLIIHFRTHPAPVLYSHLALIWWEQMV